MEETTVQVSDRVRSAWRTLKETELDRPPFFHLDETVDEKNIQVVQKRLDSSLSHPINWRRDLNDLVGKHRTPSIVTYIEDLDSLCIIFGSTAYLQPIGHLHKTKMIATSEEDIAFVAHSAELNCLAIFTQRTVAVSGIGPKLEDGSYVMWESVDSPMVLPTEPTAVITSVDGEIYVGGSNGRVYQLLVEKGQNCFYEKALEPLGSRWKWTRLFPLSPIKTIKIDQERNIILCLHKGSEIEVFSLDGQLLTLFMDDKIEVDSIICLPFQSSDLASFIGMSTDGDIHWFTWSEASRNGMKCRTSSVFAQMLMRRRHEEMILLSFCTDKILLAMSDKGETLSTRLKWLTLVGSGSQQTFMVEEASHPLKGEFLALQKIRAPSRSPDVSKILPDVEISEDPLSKQFFKPYGLLMVVTSEERVLIKPEMPRETLGKILRNGDVEGLSAFREIYGPVDTICQILMLETNGSCDGTKAVLIDNQLRYSAVPGFYAAFKRTISPIWDVCLFQLHNLKLRATLQKSTIEWYIDTLTKFAAIVDKFTDGVKQFRFRFDGDAFLPQADLDDLYNLKLLCDYCVQILAVVEVVGSAETLDSHLLLFNSRYFLAVLAEGIKSLTTYKRGFWSLADLTQEQPSHSPLISLTAALFWRGWFPGHSKLESLKLKAPDLSSNMEIKDMSNIFRFLKI